MRSGNRRPASRRPASATPFRLMIELDAVMDYMTMLRGMTAHGHFYEDFISDELTRYPSFDGSDWKDLLPEGTEFQDFLSDAISGNNVRQAKLFKKVRPYDFAYRDLAFVHRKNAEIVIHVPPMFEEHTPEIREWFRRLFPDQNRYLPIKVVSNDHSSDPDKADLWVARNPKTATWLKDAGRPFILIDGKENKHIEGVVRVLRWDQAGFLIRHAQLIDFLKKNYPLAKPEAFRPAAPLYPPHMDIWQGNVVIILPNDDSVKWVGDQLKSLELIELDSDRLLRYRPEPFSADTPGKPYGPELVQRVLKINEIDLAELERKKGVLFELMREKFESISRHPGWTGKIRERNENMQFVLSDLEKELGIDPVTGRKLFKRRQNIPVMKDSSGFGDRLIQGSHLEPVLFNRSFSEGIRLLAGNWDVVRLEEYAGNRDNIAGHLGELSTLLLLKEEGWKLLVPVKRNGEETSIASRLHLPKFMRGPGQEVEKVSEFARVDLSWEDLSTGEIKTAEVDFVARGPNNFLVIGEVKLTSNTDLSESQIALRDHIANGGRIINPGFPGIRYKTFKPAWREIHVDDGPLRPVTPTTTLEQMAGDLPR